MISVQNWYKGSWLLYSPGFKGAGESWAYCHTTSWFRESSHYFLLYTLPGVGASFRRHSFHDNSFLLTLFLLDAHAKVVEQALTLFGGCFPRKSFYSYLQNKIPMKYKDLRVMEDLAPSTWPVTA